MGNDRTYTSSGSKSRDTRGAEPSQDDLRQELRDGKDKDSTSGSGSGSGKGSTSSSQSTSGQKSGGGSSKRTHH